MLKVLEHSVKPYVDGILYIYVINAEKGFVYESAIFQMLRSQCNYYTDEMQSSGADPGSCKGGVIMLSINLTFIKSMSINLYILTTLLNKHKSMHGLFSYVVVNGLMQRTRRG